MSTLFFTLVVLSVYSYVIYPILLKLVNLVYKKENIYQSYSCPVSLIISAYNEEAVIGEKIENSLALDYPAEDLEIVVVSDGSTDSTDQIVKQYADQNVNLISCKTRRGKTAGLNDAMEKAKGEIVIFTDADSMYPTDAVQKFSEVFSDTSIGLVTGTTDYLEQGREGIAQTASFYTKLERLIKNLETSSGSCVGADGAIFAIRKDLYVLLKDDDINDLVIPLNVIKSGKRTVLRDDLVCGEPSSTNEKSAFYRQARITNRTIRALFRNLDLLNFLKYKEFSFKLISHKFIRLSVPFFMLVLIPLNLFLINAGAVFVICAFLQTLFYGFSILGRYFGPFKPFNHFVLVQISILYGWYLYLKGESLVTWNPRN